MTLERNLTLQIIKDSYPSTKWVQIEVKNIYRLLEYAYVSKTIGTVNLQLARMHIENMQLNC